MYSAMGAFGHRLYGASGEDPRDEPEPFLVGPIFVGRAMLQPFDPKVLILLRPDPDVAQKSLALGFAFFRAF